MTQSDIDKRSTTDYDQQLRRHLIASLRIVEARLGVTSSLKDTIGKGK